MHVIPALWRRMRLAAAVLLAIAIAIPALGAASSAQAASPSLPCDIYAAGGTPCEAAYSTTRALFASYDGPLYQVQRVSDGSHLDIGLRSTGGVVDVAPQNTFCAGTFCTITDIYDQTPNGNAMTVSPAASCPGCGGAPGPGPNGSDLPAPASALPVTVQGQPAYGIMVDSSGVGYRIDNAKKVPTGSQPEGIYMLTSSNITSSHCCFDFGSGETDNDDDGNATMNAIYYGTACWTNNCSGTGPWVGGDIENGMYFSDTGANPSSISAERGTFLSAWEKNNGTTNFTLKYGDGQKGALSTGYSGPLPNGYNPMKVQNSILLGTGGDNSGGGTGEFFEGAVTAGYPSDATENAVQASITAADYGGNVFGVQSTRSVVSLKAHANGRYVDAPDKNTSLTADATSIGTNETFDLTERPDGTVSLRARSNGDYVTAENKGTVPLIANRTALGSQETFDLIHNPDGSVSFHAHANGDIVTADNAGASPLIANRTKVGPWEEFDIVPDPATVSFRAHSDDKYVTAENAGASPLIANRTAIGPWETFDLIGNSDGTVSLKAHADGRYVEAAGAGTALIADSTSIGPAEEFDLVSNDDGSVSLQSTNGHYVTAADTSTALTAGPAYIGPSEEFDLSYD